MKLNRKWMLVIALVLSVAMATSGTMAYLTSTDADVNVMTLGNVKIEQHEYERAVDANGNYEEIYAEERGENGYKLTDFTPGKPLVPATGAVTGWDDMAVCFEQLDGNKLGRMTVLDGLNNVQDKFVFVENTGKSDAYVRTLIAYEVGSSTEAFGDLIMASVNTFWKANDVGVVAIDGNNYYVVEYVYDGNQYPEGGAMIEDANGKHSDGIVHPGEFTYNNLAQVYMTSKATNEDVEAIDGNKNGTYDILVLSQAVQTAGFADAKTALDTAFGEATDANIKAWFEGEDGPEVPVTVSSAEELANQLKAGKDVTMTKDIDAGGQVFVVNGGTLDGNGKTLTVDSGSAAYESGLTVAEGTAKNVTVTGAYRGLGVGGSGASAMTGDVTYENVTVTGATYGINIGVGNGHKLTMIDCTLGDWNSMSGLSEGYFKGCTFTSEGKWYACQRISANATFTYENCEFNQNTYDNAEGDNKYYLDSYGNGKIVLKNCTMNGVAITSANVNELFDIDEVTVEVQ